MYIENDDKELFKKIREIWNKIIELIGVNDTPDFVQTTLDNGGKFTEAYVLENTVFTDDIYNDELVLVLHSVFNDYLSKIISSIQILMQINTPINHINKHTIKIYNRCTYTILFYFFSLMHNKILIKKLFFYTFNSYKVSSKKTRG